MVTFLTYQQRLSLFVRGGRAAPTYMQHGATPISNACHSLLGVARGSNIHATFLFQIMVAFLSYISNGCHALFVRGGRAAPTYMQHNMVTFSSYGISATCVTLFQGCSACRNYRRATCQSDQNAMTCVNANVMSGDSGREWCAEPDRMVWHACVVRVSHRRSFVLRTQRHASFNNYVRQ